MRSELLSAAVLAALALGSAGLASADTVPVTKSNGDFVPGTGILADNFTISTGTGRESVALKARDRDTGQPLSISGTTYAVSPGLSTDAPGQTQFRFDFQFTPGAASNYWLQLMIDFDPTAGQDFVTLEGLVFGYWNGGGDSYLTNPGSGAWSDNTTPYLVANSSRLDFAFWSSYYGKSYDPNAPGTYDLVFSAYSADPTNGGALLSSVSITAQVVPLPAAFWPGLAMLGILAVGGLRKKLFAH